MTALEKSLQFGNHECHKWREANFWSPLPSLAEDLAAGFVHVASRHGNAAGNRWLRRHASDLIEPGHIYQRFAPIADDLMKGAAAIRARESSSIEGIRAANDWLIEIEKRLKVGAFTATHDDDALVSYAEAQTRAIEQERDSIIGNIADYNRRRRNGLLPVPVPPCELSGPLSERARQYREHVADSRNPLTPPPLCAPLMAVFHFNYLPPMSLSVATEMALSQARKRARLHSIVPPPLSWSSERQLARLSCSLWWRRQLRRICGRRLEQVQRDAHRVHKRAGIYCSNMTLARRSQQKIRNRALLETLEAINQDGQTYTLAELAELGLANADHRRAELMLRIRDTEAEAQRLGHLGMFFTITVPSRFHPVHAKNCHRNSKYDGSTPREAQQHLQKVWAKARAKLAREGLAVYGIRVVEPHHDGTPHWHLLLWMKPEDEPRVVEVLREYAESESPEELYDRWGNKSSARFKAVKIDYSRGTAAGYVAKYISKNINGQQFMEADNYGQEMASSAPRIEAWAAVWGIRQFQFVGLPSVTVWREIRRLTEQQSEQLRLWEEATRPIPRAARCLHEIRKAANAGQWDLFLRLMGGPNTPRKDQPIKPWVVTRMDPNRDPFSHATGEVITGIEKRGRYGEAIKSTVGLVVKDGRGDASEYLTRLFRWEIRSRKQNAVGRFGVGEAGDAWTCVNNCTGVDITPRTPPPEILADQLKRFQEWRESEVTRAEIESADIEARYVRAATLRLIQNDPTARRVLAERGRFIPAPIPEQEEYFPPELC
uniref:replication endonuclease n=1 Tax=Halomonas sp. TaxID=1486246 RepID=UPI00261E7808|nr:replication endonuclease [Halomonas sp.]